MLDYLFPVFIYSLLVVCRPLVIVLVSSKAIKTISELIGVHAWVSPAMHLIGPTRSQCVQIVIRYPSRVGGKLAFNL